MLQREISVTDSKYPLENSDIAIVMTSIAATSTPLVQINYALLDHL